MCAHPAKQESLAARNVRAANISFPLEDGWLRKHNPIKQTHILTELESSTTKSAVNIETNLLKTEGTLK